MLLKSLFLWAVLWGSEIAQLSQNTISCVTVSMSINSWIFEFLSLPCAAHAAQIVLNVPVKKIMIPIDVTHTAIVTKEIYGRLLNPASGLGSTALAGPVTNLRHTLSTLISFFAETYKSTFGFDDGPPLHDALTIAYVAQPDLFEATRYRVDIELTGTHSLGQTVVDIWGYRPCDDTWGRNGRNCLVAKSLNVRCPIFAAFDILLHWLCQVERFFDLFLEAVLRCDQKSPLNK